MRRLSVAALTLLFVLAVAGPAAANGPPVVVTEPPFTFTDVNPCTGLPHDITVTPTLVIHQFELNDPDRHHFNVQIFADVETSDGFFGNAVGQEIDNGSGLLGSETGGMFTSIVNGKLHNPTTGERARVHGNFHITDNDADGAFEAFVDNFALDCLGPS